MLNTVATIGGPSEARSGSSGLYLEFKEHSLLAHNGPKPVRLVSRELPCAGVLPSPAEGLVYRRAIDGAVCGNRRNSHLADTLLAGV